MGPFHSLYHHIRKWNKLNLENLRKQKLPGHFVISCVRWIEQGEKTNKIFSEFGISKLFEQNDQKSRTRKKGNY